MCRVQQETQPFGQVRMEKTLKVHQDIQAIDQSDQVIKALSGQS